MAEKPSRTFDDLVRLVAVLICAAPVGTYCILYFLNYALAKAGGNPLPLNEVREGLRDIVLLIIGAAGSLAFGRRNSTTPIEKAE
jgi:hypothetical protein